MLHQNTQTYVLDWFDFFSSNMKWLNEFLQPSISHLFADHLALIIDASPWWHRTEFAPPTEQIGQQALTQVQACAAEWKQPINFSKTEW